AGRCSCPSSRRRAAPPERPPPPRHGSICGSFARSGRRGLRRRRGGFRRGRPAGRIGSEIGNLEGEERVACRRLRAAILLQRRGLVTRSEEHTSELQSLAYLVCRLLLEKK